MKKTLILHPFFFTIYAVLAPSAHNIKYVGLGAIRILILSLISVIFLLYLVNLLVKHRDRTSLLITGGVLCFFSYGHLNNLLSQKLGASPALDAALLLVMGLALALWAQVVLNRQLTTVHMTNYLNITGFVLLIFPIYGILTYAHQSASLPELAAKYQQQAMITGGIDQLQPLQAFEHPLHPDIYYIILDGYTRADILQELYNYDNSDFLNELEKRGFYIAHSSRANYTDTVYSIASSLNMIQINTLPEFAYQWGGITQDDVLKKSPVA